MKIAKDIFTCIIIVNLTAYLAFFGTMIFFQSLDEVARPVCAVYWSSFLTLLVSSTIFLFLDWRAASRGFLVLFFGIFVAALFPEL